MVMDELEEKTAEDSSIFSRYLIGRLRHLMFNARLKELAPYHISPRQSTIIFILYTLGHKATLSELAKRTDRKMSTLSIQLVRMEKDGLVKKAREVPKSAQKSIELTEKGVDLYKKSYDMKSVKEIMSILSEEERQQLISLLRKVISKAEKYQT